MLGYILRVSNKRVYHIRLPDKARGHICYTWEDKAGGYGIQGTFAKYVKGIKGDYYNVVGLPISRLYRELNKLKETTG
jgi:predicted house-cleaning NTP pyrophosphatase (Maf/HAM1 superfamily)